MVQPKYRRFGKSKTFAILQVFALVAATLGIYGAQSSSPANAYQVNTSAPTGTTGGSTTAITEPSGLVTTVSLTGGMAVTDVVSTMGSSGSSSALYAPAVPATTPSFRLTLTPPASCLPGATCTGLGTIKVTFSQPVTNPTIHVYGLGAMDAATFPTRGTRGHAVLTLASSVPSGASLGAVNATATNLQVIGGATIDVVNYNASTQCNTLADATPNAAALAGCGSVPVVGTVSELVFSTGFGSQFIGTGAPPETSADAFGLLVTASEDFGDAPASYDGAQAAMHSVGDLHLGASEDAENPTTANATTSPNAGAAATGDGADEDAFTTVPDVTAMGGGSYSLTVPVSGVSKAARLCGFIDFNKGGTFDTAGEMACANVAVGATSTTLTWTVPAGVVTGTTYARFRLGYTAAQVQTPTGRADSGEVEDYTVRITGDPQLTLSKSASPTTATTAGATIAYSFLVTNTGNVTITGVSIADTLTAPAGPALSITCPAGAASLAPGASVTCTATYTVTQADVNHGRIDNSATASGTAPILGTVTSPPSSAAVTIAPTPRLTVVKSATPTTASKAGDSVAYSFLVTNTGNVTITNVTIDDTMTAPAGPAPSVTCPAGAASLAPAASVTCTGSYTVTQADVDHGRIDNSATASGKDSSGTTTTSLTSTATVTIAPAPRLVVAKSAAPTTVTKAGDAVSYTFVVTNTGNVTVTNVSVADTLTAPAGPGVSVTCPAGASSLAPGASVTCSGSYVVTQADVDHGRIDNSAVASGKDPSNADVASLPSTAVVTATRTAAVALDKQAGSPSGNVVGSTILYTFVVTNTGNVTLNPISVSDAKVGSVTCSVSTLAPGATTSCTATYLLTQGDVDAGHVANTATVTGTPPAGVTSAATASDSTDTPVASAPAMTLVKQAGTPSGNTAGSTIAYTFIAKNTGNVTLTSVSVNDPKLGGNVPCAATTLAVGAETTCGPVSYTLTQADVDAGHVANTASASGRPPSGTLVTASGSADTPITPAPAITVDKTHDALIGTATAGSTVTYHFLVKNTGNVTLSSVGVSDSKVSSVTCPATTLAPNASTTCAATYTLTQADIDAGVVNNTATASGKPPVTATNPAPAPVTGVDTDTLSVPAVPSITVDKTHVAPGVYAAGSVVGYSFLVKNTGNVTLNTISISDPRVPSVTCSATTLAPNASTTCTGSYTLTQVDLDAGVVNNTATASGKPPVTSATPNPTPVTGSDTDVLPVTQSPKLTLDKQAGAPSGSTAGSMILYSFVVQNTGNVTLNPVTISDSKVGVVTCAPSSLAPGATVICTKTYVMTQADVNAGHVANSATASGTPPTGGAVTAGDTTDTPVAATPSITVDKQAGPPSVNAAGGTIAYAFIVTNTGNVTLTSVGVTDAKVTPLTCPVSSLVPGASTTCTATYTLTQADVNAGHVANTATASGTPPTGSPVTGSDSTDTPITAAPKLVLDKSAGIPSGSTAGSTIAYTFLLTNTGNVTLDPIAFTDPKVNTSSCSTAALGVGASRSCTVSYTLTQADVDAGHVANTASVAGTPPGVGATPVTATDATDTTIAPAGGLTLKKTAGAPNGTNAGDTIDYTFAVTNTGNVTLTSVSVADTKITTLTCGAATLAPGAQITCSASYALTQADVDAGSVHNVATATGNPPTGAPLMATDAVTTAIPSAPVITLDKRASAPVALIAGSTIDYTFVVTNSGNVTLTLIGVDDPKAGPVTCPVTALQPTASTTCTKTYTLTQADVDAGMVVNTATASGTPPVGAPVTGTDSTTTLIAANPGIVLDKQAGPATGNKAGDTIPYTFVVTNSGTVTLTSLTISDSKVGTVTCPVASLVPAESTTCTATYTLLQSDVDAGHVDNLATAYGQPPIGDPVAATDTTDTAIPESPALTLVKSAGTPTPDNKAGSTIAYSFLVTNTGNVTLTLVGIADAKVGAVSCPATTLDPTKATTCTATYTLTQADVDNGGVLNSATAHGTSPLGTVTDSPSSSVTTSVSADPRIALDKQAGAPSTNAAGGTITYTFVVTNTGNVTLDPVGVSDDKVGAVTCPLTSLAPGASTTCSKSYTLLQSDVDAGTVHNDATATGTSPTGTAVTSDDSTDTPIVPDPRLVLDKQAAVPSVNAAGGTIAYTFVVKNTGNVTLDPIAVTDAKVDTSTCSTAALAVGASRSCTVAYVLTQADVDAGHVANTAIATGTPPGVGATATTGTDSTDTPVVPGAAITVVKTAGAPSGNTAGSTIGYSFLVTNTGNVTLTSVLVTDSKVGAVVCPATTLAPGAATTCTATYTMSQADVDSGIVHNEATVEGNPPSGDPVTGSSSVDTPVPAAPAMTLDKQAGVPSVNAAGGTILYTFIVKNTGNVTLSAVGVSDAKVGAVTCPQDALSPGESTTCTASYTLLQSDVDAGTVNNSATASGKQPVTVANPDPTPVTVGDSVDVSVTAAPALTLDKQASSPSANIVGGTIDYTFIVTNTGNVTLSAVGVSDAKVGTVTCPETTLAPGVSATCTASYTLLQSDVDSENVYNFATASGTQPVTAAHPAPTPVTAADAVNVPIVSAPAITVDKQAGAPSVDAVGGTIDYTFLVANTGNVTLGSISVADANVGAVSCPVTTLAPGENTTCTATYVLTQADVDAGTVHNSATVTGLPAASAGNPNPAPVTGTDAVDVAVTAGPTITIDKTHAAPATNTADATVAYSFVVTNTGNVTLTSVGVSDGMVGAVSCPVTTLLPGTSTTCTAPYTLTQADVDAGVVDNTASASGNPPVTAANPTLTPVTAVDTDTLLVPAAPAITVDKTHVAPATNTEGATVTYHFLVTNTGNVTLTSVGVADAMVAAVSCPSSSLLPGASTTCTASYTLTQADVDAGVVDNTATASGTQPATAADPTPTPVTATDSDTLQIPAAPGMTVDKQATGPATNTAGATIAYTFLVTNTGNVTLGAIAVSDAKVGAVDCPDTTLAPAASTTCTASYTLTQADVDAGTVHNSATASGTPPVTATTPTPTPTTATDAVDVAIPAAAALSVVKSGAAPSANVVGGTIAFSFLVTNTGNVTVGSITVADALVGTVNCPMTTLAPAEFTTCTATYTLTQADVNAGTVHNSATVSGLPPATVADPSPAPVTATGATDVAVTSAPAITLVKSAGTPSADAEGATIDYTFLVTNTGNVTVNAVGVTDPKVGAVTCGATTLVPGAATTCTGTYTLTQADVDAGTVHNSAIASGTPPVTAADRSPTPVTATDAVDVTVKAAPAITLVKSASAPTTDAAGGTIAYEFRVTNTGNVTLSSVGVEDARVGAVSCPDTTLAPAAFTTCTATYTLTQADVDSGTVHNSATASGTQPVTAANPDPTPVTDANSVDVSIASTPSLALDKQAGAPTGFRAGDRIPYTFVVTNTGNVTLSSVAVTDAKVGTVTCPVTTLAPATSTACTATYTVTQSDVDAGHLANAASVMGDPPTGGPVTISDETETVIPAAPMLTLEKKPGARSGTSAGSTIEFTFLVTNTGNVTVTKIAVLDTKVPAVTCPVAQLAPGESTLCTATYTMTAADVKAGKVLNSARASGVLLGCTVSGGSSAPLRALDACDPVIADDTVTVPVPPNTGSPVGPLAPVAALLTLACGGALVVAGRRRRHS